MWQMLTWRLCAAGAYRGMTRDENTYPDADAFNPGRWLDPKYPTYKEPLTIYPNLNGFSQFGFGRRTCQGVPIVDQDLFLAMGGLAWAFDIRKKRHPDGTEVPVHWNDYTPLLIAKPKPFEFDAIVRGEKKREMLKSMWEVGKGHDDEEEERQQLGKGKYNRGEHEYETDRFKGLNSDDDIGSDRGSDTSNAITDAGEPSSSVHSVRSLSDLRSEGGNDIWA